jgi:hypothetical protein
MYIDKNGSKLHKIKEYANQFELAMHRKIGRVLSSTVGTKWIVSRLAFHVILGR